MSFGQVSYVAAFMAGVFSFFSPCILPMIPAYIMFITGASLEEDVKGNRIKAVVRTSFFILGFTIIFMIMGTSASLIGRMFQENREIFTKISGGLIVFFGLVLMGVIRSPFQSSRIRLPKAVKGNAGAFLVGMAFAAGWTPCFGPVLAGILVLASASSTWGQGVFLLATYALGMGIPFLLTALFINEFSRVLQKSEKIVPVVLKIGGGIMVVFGLLVFFDKMMWLLNLI